MAKIKTEAELREILTAEQYHVTQEAGTERPHTHEYNQQWDLGTYHCICCDTPLFLSDTKFDAGCGWPSFFSSINKGAIKELDDFSIPGRPRTEIRCNQCDAHLGHVFDDGPKPTGLRYCLNGAALNFVKS